MYPPVVDEEPELIFASKTQTAEQLTKALADVGYTVTEEQTTSDQEPAVEALATEDEPTEEEPTTEAAGEVEAGEPEGAPPAPATAEPVTPAKPRNVPGSAKLKQERDRYKAELESEKTAKANALAEKDRLEREITELRKPKPAEAPPAAAPPVAAPPTPAAVDDPEPKEEDFPDDYAKFLKESSRWAYRDEARQKDKLTKLATEQAERERIVTAGKTAIEREQKWNQTAQQRWEAASKKALEKRPDFLTVISAPGQAISTLLRDAVQDRCEEDGTELAYFLRQHPAEEAKVNALATLPEGASAYQARLATVAVHKALDKIVKEHKLLTPQPAAAVPPAQAAPPAAPPAAPATATTAKVPPKKVTPPTPLGSGRPAVHKKLSNMSAAEVSALSMEEYRARMEAGEGS